MLEGRIPERADWMRDGGLSPVVMSIAAIISRSLIMVDGDVNKSNTRCTDDSDCD